MRLWGLCVVGLWAVAACGGKVDEASGDASAPPSSGSRPPPPSYDASVPIFDGGVVGLPDVFPSTDAASDAPLGCQPESPFSFTPVAVTPVVDQACTPEQANEYYADCVAAGATQATCIAFMMGTNAPSCASCLLSYYGGTTGHTPNPPPASAVSPWGPLIMVNDLVVLNVGACVALADPSNAGIYCGTALNNVLECEYTACAANCPIDGPSSSEYLAQVDAYESCTNAADQGVCASFVNTQDHACGAYTTDGGAGPASFCFAAAFPGAAGSSAQETADFYQLVLQQCGTNADP
jgi:hypothetical protein